MELTINIKQESKVKFVTELLNNISYVEIKNSKPKKASTKKNETSPKVSPTMLFGAWANLDIDAKQLRKNTWRKS
jgi:hypothetical protein